MEGGGARKDEEEKKHSKLFEIEGVGKIEFLLQIYSETSYEHLSSTA